MKIYGIVGAGGSGRTIMPSLRRMLEQRGESADCCFVDDDDDLLAAGQRDGHLVVSFATFCENPSPTVLVSHANPATKQAWVERCRDMGLSFFNVVDPTHISYSDINSSTGSAFLAHSVSTVNTKIGDHVHLNIFSYIEHDSVVGDYVTFGPRAGCNGWVEICEGAYIGAYACVINGNHRRRVRVGRHAVVGMGAVVIADVPDGVTVAGNPARIIRGGE